MNKKKALARAPVRAPVKAPVPSPLAGGSEVVELEENEIAGVVDELSIDQKIREWVARENVESLTPRTYLYKFENPVSGDHKVLCDRIDEDIPDPHSVGLQFGAGRYMMIVTIPVASGEKPKARGLRFRLHARYDELRKKAENGQAVQPATMGNYPAQNPGSSIRDGLEMVKTVVDMIRPLLEVKQAPAPDMSRVLESQYDMMAGVLRKSLTNSQDLINEVQRAKMENAGGGESVNDEPDFLTKVMPLVEKFLPVLMGGGAGANATAAAIRALPEFGQITREPHELRRVVEWLDKSQGKEKTDRVLAALKVRRPGINGVARRAAVSPAGAGVVRG